MSSQMLTAVVEELQNETGQFNLGDTEAAARVEQIQREIGEDVIIAWSESLSVGINQIDNQHRRLVTLVNKLYQAVKTKQSGTIIGQILGELIAYTKTHFGDEEALMEQYHYPELAEHKKIHSQLVEQVLDYKRQLDAGAPGMETTLLTFLKNWLVDHIMITDKKYSSHLRGQGAK